MYRRCFLGSLLSFRRIYEQQGRPIQLLSPADEMATIERFDVKRSAEGLTTTEALVLRKLKLQRVSVFIFTFLACAYTVATYALGAVHSTAAHSICLSLHFAHRHRLQAFLHSRLLVKCPHRTPRSSMHCTRSARHLTKIRSCPAFPVYIPPLLPSAEPMPLQWTGRAAPPGWRSWKTYACITL
jgi:hypothetical protein